MAKKENNESWTVTTLKEYMERGFEYQDKAVQAALAAQEKAVAAALTAAKEAVLKAEAASEKRFESVNEFRATLSDQTNTLMPRQEYTVQHKALEDKLTDLTNRLNKSDGVKQGSEVTIGKIYAAVGVVAAIVGIIVLLVDNIF